MHSFDGLIEITQDAAGVIETKNRNQKGFFTAGVMTCLVTVYVCKNATVIVHDSGQIRLTHIATLIKQYGTVRKLIAAYGMHARQSHFPRLDKIINIAGVGKRQVKKEHVPLEAFAFLCSTSGEYHVHADNIPSFVERMPEYEKRQSVCEVNNFFLDINAQSLSLDIQYKEGAYAPARKLNKSLSELLEITKKQPGHFFQNISFLNECHARGALELPQYLRDLAIKYQLDRLRKVMPTQQDRADEKIEFKKYVEISA